MPRIQVNEKDLSWYYRQRTPGQLTVFMPGIATFGPSVPTLVDANTFMKVFGTDVATTEDLSYLMASSFVKAGINVLFFRIVPDDAVAASNTVNGLTITAKYAGTFGNKLSAKVNGTAGSVNVGVYLNGVLVESLIYNMINPNSEYYYETVNASSVYVEVTGNLTATTNEAVVLGNGSNGTLTSIPTKILAEKNKTFVSLVDKFSYDFNIIVDGGYNDLVRPTESGATITSLSGIDELLTELAVLRGNAVYLVGGLKDFTATEMYDYTGLTTATAQMTSIAATTAIAALGFNTSYAVGIGPWCSSEVVSSGAVRTLPGYYPFLIRWGQSIASGNPLWVAPAGVKRASLGAIVRKPVTEIGAAELDLWQNHEYIQTTTKEHGVNPIMRLKQYGYVVYGNSTLLQTRADGATSVLQSFSTRILVNLIKSRAFDTSLTLQFDQIDDDLFAEFKTLMTVFMDQLKYGGALYDYQIVIDRSTMTLDELNSRTVPVRIMISPNLPVENFVINLEISQSGVTFGADSMENSVYTESLVTE